MKRTAVVLVSIVLVFLAGQPAFPQTVDDRAIRPGESIGAFRLGMTVDQIGAILGRRPDAESVDGTLRVYRWNLEGSVHSGVTSVPAVTVSVGADGTAEVISTTSTAFATPGGSGVGLSLNAFKQEFGSAYRGYKDSAGVGHLRFDTAGVALTYDIRGPGLTTVRSLIIFRPAAAMPGPAAAILPGTGIGPVRLGMSAEEATRAMGRPPQARRPGVMVWVLDGKDTFGDNAWLTVFFNNAGAVDFLLTDALAHRTAQGNGPGAGILDLQAEFGAAFLSVPFVVPGETSFMGIWYEQPGIVGLYHPADPNKRILLVAVYKK